LPVCTRRHRRLFAATTFAVLYYEIALTRLYAYIFTYHLTALAVSAAVFGLGAGAFVRVRWLSSLPQRELATAAHLGNTPELRQQQGHGGKHRQQFGEQRHDARQPPLGQAGRANAGAGCHHVRRPGCCWVRK